MEVLGSAPDLPRDPLVLNDRRRGSFGGLPFESPGVVRELVTEDKRPTGLLRDDLGVLTRQGVQEIEAEIGHAIQVGDRSVTQEDMPPAVRLGEFAVKLDEEERELWRQLRRKSEFELRVAEKRALLAEVRDKRREVSSALADAEQSVENLTGQVEFTMMHEREVEHDIAVLRESNRILQTAFQEKKMRKEEKEFELAHGHLPHHLTDAEKRAIRQKAREKANTIEQKREKEALVEAEQIEHLREHLKRLIYEKSGLQRRQQELLEKQHSAEQDRNLLLSSLQEERRGINVLRQQRLRLWEDRHIMESEMTTIVQQAHFRMQKERSGQRYRGGVDPNIIAAEENANLPDPFDPFAQDAIDGKSILKEGVRKPAKLDTPSVYNSQGLDDRYTWRDGRKEPISASRKSWTSFDRDAVPRGALGVADSSGVGFGMTSALQHMEAPTSGITEWSGRIQEYRQGGGGSK